VANGNYKDHELGVFDGVDDAVIALADAVQIIGSLELFRPRRPRVV
jgi:hypothetical protein